MESTVTQMLHCFAMLTIRLLAIVSEQNSTLTEEIQSSEQRTVIPRIHSKVPKRMRVYLRESPKMLFVFKHRQCEGCHSCKKLNNYR